MQFKSTEREKTVLQRDGTNMHNTLLLANGREFTPVLAGFTLCDFFCLSRLLLNRLYDMIPVRSWLKAKADSPKFTVRNPLETKTNGN